MGSRVALLIGQVDAQRTLQPKPCKRLDHILSILEGHFRQESISYLSQIGRELILAMTCKEQLRG